MTRLIESDTRQYPFTSIDPVTGERKRRIAVKSGIDPATNQRVIIDHKGLGFTPSQQSPQLLVRAEQHDEPQDDPETPQEAAEAAPHGYLPVMIWRQGAIVGSAFLRSLGHDQETGLLLYTDQAGIHRYVARVSGSGVERLEANGER